MCVAYEIQARNLADFVGCAKKFELVIREIQAYLVVVQRYGAHRRNSGSARQRPMLSMFRSSLPINKSYFSFDRSKMA
jgi:hypothetical protein